MKKILSIIMIITAVISITSCFSSNPITNTPNTQQNEQVNKKPVEEKEEKFIFIFETMGGTHIPPLKGNILDSPPYTEQEGYRFEGWYVDPTLTQAVVYPMKITSDTIIFAKWLKLKNTINLQDCNLKNKALYYSLTPNGFEIDRLAELGYMLKITVEYDVRYKKDYDVPLDIGYFGSPKYEVSITNSEKIGIYENDLTTNKKADTRTIVYICSAADLKNETIKLKFSSDNIQNILYFENITVTYEFQ